jgi:hypothetical protein
MTTRYGKKIGTDPTYKRPVVTYQEQLQQDDISSKLIGYKQIENIFDVPINAHLRYFSGDGNGNQQFRMGGFLKRREPGDPYVILTNGKLDWSVQIANTVWFNKITREVQTDDDRSALSIVIEQKDAEISRLKKLTGEDAKEDECNYKMVIIKKNQEIAAKDEQIQNLKKALRKLLKERRRILGLPDN